MRDLDKKKPTSLSEGHNTLLDLCTLLTSVDAAFEFNVIELFCSSGLWNRALLVVWDG